MGTLLFKKDDIHSIFKGTKEINGNSSEYICMVTSSDTLSEH